MTWLITTEHNPAAIALADRHYTRTVFRKGSKGKKIAGTSRCITLLSSTCDAVWVATWPDPSARNDGLDVWVNSLFRNESARRSSDLIREALAITLWHWRDAPLPADGLRTYIAPQCVASAYPGWCYVRAGFKRTGTTQGGLLTYVYSAARLRHIALQPAPQWAYADQLSLFGDAA